MTQDPTRAAVEAAENYAYDPDSPREANSRDSWVDPKQAFLAGVKWQATAPKPLGDVREAARDMAAALRNTPAQALREAGYLDRAADMLERSEPRGCPTPGACSCPAASLAAPAVPDREAE